MKFVTKLVLSLLLTGTAVYSIENNFKISSETISWGEVESSDSYKNIREPFEEQHRTLIRFECYPENESEFKFYMKRPLLMEKMQKNELIGGMEALLATGAGVSENRPIFILIGAGYFPGEKIGLAVKCNNHFTFKSNVLVFTPNPLIDASKSDSAVVSAELTMISPPVYNISLRGFEANEVLSYQSTSCGETMAQKMDVDKACEIIYSPEVVGSEGGVAKVTFTRNNGEELSLDMPWGSEFVEHIRGHREPTVDYFSSIKLPT